MYLAIDYDVTKRDTKHGENKPRWTVTVSEGRSPKKHEELTKKKSRFVSQGNQLSLRVRRRGATLAALSQRVALLLYDKQATLEYTPAHES